MLSILIPTYNYNITALATELHKQAMEQYVDFEIIVMEDGSTLFKNENRTVNNLKFCQYIILPQNIGRSAIRNKLADTAKYDHLLFLDCDAEICSNHFIERYLTFCTDECVVMGGRIYDEKENNPNKSLILTYGKKRERYNHPNLNKNIHKMFMTPNFLISKSIFNNVRFNETIIGYGHEDTIFGIELQQLNIDFILIDNPVLHKGLEDNATYIKKNEFALQNLYGIYKKGKYPTLENKSKVLKLFICIKKYHLQYLISKIFTLIKPILILNLNGPKPNLTLFDFYKLGHLCAYTLKNDNLSVE